MNKIIKSSDTIGFIITKPLQLLVIFSLFDQLPKQIRKEILIIDLFADARGVCQRLSAIMPEDCTAFFLENEKSAFAQAAQKRYVKIFMDSDVGFVRNLSLMILKLQSPKTILAVYEEGLGTYRNDLYQGLKKSVLSLLGCGVYFGGNWLVRELYLYRPEECANLMHSEKIKIHKKIQTLLQEDWNKFEFIFDTAGFFDQIERQVNDQSNCTIYISNWHLDRTIVSILRSTVGLVIVKPHPHIKNLEEIKFYESLILAKATVPAEMLIIWASSHFESVSVVHHGSSVVRYIDFDNVVFLYVSAQGPETFYHGKIC